MTAEQLDLLNPTAAREDAIRRADEGADERWRKAADGALRMVARRGRYFTADDVWDQLTMWEHTTHQPSALGPVFRRASRAGLIRKTGELRLSRNPRRHRDLVVWVGV